MVIPWKKRQVTTMSLNMNRTSHRAGVEAAAVTATTPCGEEEEGGSSSEVGTVEMAGEGTEWRERGGAAAAIRDNNVLAAAATATTTAAASTRTVTAGTVQQQ